MGITNFEEKSEKFKVWFVGSHDLAAPPFQEVSTEIGKWFIHLQKAQDNLSRPGNKLRLPDDKAQDVTIKS